MDVYPSREYESLDEIVVKFVAKHDQRVERACFGVAGGIAPRIVEKLLEGTFMDAFVDKGRMTPVLERVPVRVIRNDRAALLGAARLASLGIEVC